MLPTDFAFIIKVDDRYFLSAIDGRSVTGSVALSNAQHFDYRGADRICQQLRLHGYPQSVVCELTGRPVTEQTFREVIAAPPKSEPDLPKDQADIYRIPAATLKKRMRTDPIFAKRVASIFATA